MFVSAVSVWEIEIKRKKGQLKTPENLIQAIIDTKFSFLSMTEYHAVKAASLPEYHKAQICWYLTWRPPREVPSNS